MAGPLSDITTRIAPPPPDQDEVDAAKKADEEKAAADAPTTKLDSVVVTGKRTHEDSEAEKVRKALEQKKKKPAPDPDLNHASKGMKEMAEWTTDPDSYRDHPGDPTTKFNAPAGDETAGCGADITQGCKPHR